MQYEKNEQEIRERLTDEQYFVTQHAGTERAFTGCYWDTKEVGRYHCIVCDVELLRVRQSLIQELVGRASLRLWEPVRSREN